MSLSLTELVRLLEQRHHIFAADPTVVTEQLRQTPQSHLDKLYYRAKLIDKNHILADRLASHQRHLQWLLYAATAAWAVIGFLATYGLMQHSALNFFMMLMAILGMNTIMLMIWLLNLLLRRQVANMWTIPLFHWKNSDPIGQAIMQMYTTETFRPYMLWRKSAIMHRLALMGLLGMFAATLLMLLVRQYRFTWESTLLSNQTLTHAMTIVAWLPEKLGFDVPHTAAILASRNQLDEANAAAWGSLLLGSLLCYGIVPRVLAWAVSVWQAKQHQPTLNIQLPYYQNIIQRWQRKIVDSDQDYVPDTVATRQPSTITLPTNVQYWAVAIDRQPANQTQWYQDVLAHEWLDKGIIASRDEWNHFTQQLTQQPVQLLVAIYAGQTPDRGTIRRLARLGANIVLWLWADETSESTQERLQQWHEVCEQYGWIWIDR